MSPTPPAGRQVVLVHCPPHGEVEFLNIGLAYLQAVLQQAGHQTLCHDISFAEHHAGTDFYDDYILELSRRIGGGVGDGVDPRLLLEVVHPEAFDRLPPLAETIVRKADQHLLRIRDGGEVFLFSLNVLTQYFAAALASRLRKLGKRTAAGGPNLGCEPLRNLLLRAGVFDAVVVGDGEGVVAPLVEQLESRAEPVPLPGVYRLTTDGAVTGSPPAAPLPVDSLPRPSLAGMTLNNFVPILASRGCARRCAFCSETSKARFRQRTAAAVVAEMEWAAASYHNQNFHFHDDQINGSAAWTDEFCELLVERRHRFTWESFCGPEGLTPARLDAMRRSGCVLLKLGVQSFSDRVLQLMRRRPDPTAIKETILHGARIGVSMRFDMLTCFPGETDEDHRLNLQVLKEIYAQTAEVHFSPNPFYLSIGSETEMHPDRFGIRVEHFDPETLPATLGDLVRASGHFPIGFAYGIGPDTVRQRMDDLGAVLKQRGIDYLYLGQKQRPTGGPRPGRRGGPTGTTR
ncbi:MAG: radical SAM protein [Deltaproteobacteria bacterium]|nr:radical SAM protein [Deltaproteobacteria bacterium]